MYMYSLLKTDLHERVPSSDKLVWFCDSCDFVNEFLNALLQHEIQILHQQVATEISEIENKIISGESIQSTVSYIMYTVPMIGLVLIRVTL